MLTSFIFTLSAASAAFAHSHSRSVQLPGGRRWYQERSSIHELFQRDVTTDGGSYAAVGSAEWTAAYPTAAPTADDMPQLWKDALTAAVAAGKIPDIPASDVSSGSPVYADGYDPNGDVVCSATYKCRNSGDVWDAPDGSIGIGFDDGPEAGTFKLIEFLTAQSQPSTHFLIGINILWHPAEFTAILDNDDASIAVHTYSHPYMTSKTNEEVVAELGWTLQIIHDSAGGRIPKFWRPPYGDSDNRVRAIAEEVFGMQAIIWNQDTEDWSMASGGTTMEAINASMTTWITGAKSPGLIILEHELTNDTAQAFMDAYPVMKQNGWETTSVVLLSSDSAYQNADGDDGTVTAADSILAYGNSSSSASADSSSSSSSQASGSTSSTSHTATSASGSASASASSSATPANDASTQRISLALVSAMLLIASTILA